MRGKGDALPASGEPDMNIQERTSVDFSEHPDTSKGGLSRLAMGSKHGGSLAWFPFGLRKQRGWPCLFLAQLPRTLRLVVGNGSEFRLAAKLRFDFRENFGV